MKNSIILLGIVLLSSIFVSCSDGTSYEESLESVKVMDIPNLSANEVDTMQVVIGEQYDESTELYLFQDNKLVSKAYILDYYASPIDDGLAVFLAVLIFILLGVIVAMISSASSL